MDFEEQVKTSELVFKGGLVQVERQQVILPDQTTATREIVHHQPAIAVLMVTLHHFGQSHIWNSNFQQKIR